MVQDNAPNTAELRPAARGVISMSCQTIDLASLGLGAISGVLCHSCATSFFFMVVQPPGVGKRSGCCGGEPARTRPRRISQFISSKELLNSDDPRG
jgi:hypothetical protein